VPLGGVDEDAVEIEEDGLDLGAHQRVSPTPAYLSPATQGILTTTVVASVSASKSVAWPGAIRMISPGPISSPLMRTRPATTTVSSVATRWWCVVSASPAR